MDYEGIKTLLRPAEEAFPRLSHVWLDAGYRGEDKGGDWVEKTVGWSVELVECQRKSAPQELLMRWAREWEREGAATLDWEKFMPPRGFQVLPRRWVVERTIAWIDQNRRMSKDYERLPESAEAFIYVAMSRLMLRRLWTCVGSVDCFRLRTVRGKESSATNKPDLSTPVSPRSYPAS